MTRLASFAVVGVLISGCLLATPRPETSTYVDGNVAALKPNTGGTLVFKDSDAILFRTGLAEVAMPYAGILKAELGPTQVHSHDSPAYKVWALPQRLHKTETQLLTVEFKNGEGEDRTMILELAKPAASAVLATIQERMGSRHTGDAVSATFPLAAGGTANRGATTNGGVWWGDEYWKTNHNQNAWGAQSGTSGSK